MPLWYRENQISFQLAEFGLSFPASSWWSDRRRPRETRESRRRILGVKGHLQLACPIINSQLPCLQNCHSVAVRSGSVHREVMVPR